MTTPSPLTPTEVPVAPLPLHRLAPFVDEATLAEATRRGARLAEQLHGRVVWSINSTATGGGVAEMLPGLLGYARGLDIDARWMVIQGTPPFFDVTKRVHHALHGSSGDGSLLGDHARAIYEGVLKNNAGGLLATVRPNDLVVLHDPQTAGLVQPMVDAGARVIWRSHIGLDWQNAETVVGWAFLRPYLERADRFVFSRLEYVPDFCTERAMIIPPSIDPLSPKNEPLDDDTVRAVLVHVGLVQGDEPGPLSFLAADGSMRRVDRLASVMSSGQPPAADVPLVVQVSRWDPLKDPIGVMHGFARLASDPTAPAAALVLAGPEARGVTDDPEASETFDAVLRAWQELPANARTRVHLAMLPTDDAEENAVMVNALQRHAAVVVQKSLREGFGLTVTEAMWKARPVIASRVGGIQDQVEHDATGMLLDDPADLDAFATLLRDLLTDSDRAARIGTNARERVRTHYLPIRHLTQYAQLIEDIEIGGNGDRLS